MVMPLIRQPFQVTRLAFTQRIMPTEVIGRELGVSGRAVRYWLTGERGISPRHFTQIQRLYERTQYGVMRASGLSPTASSKYRGLYPDTFDIWKGRLETMVAKFRIRPIIHRLEKEGIDWMSLSDREKDEYLDWGDEIIRGEFERSDKDVAELEGSP